MERRKILGYSRTNANVYNLGDSIELSRKAGMNVEDYERQTMELNPQLDIVIKLERVMTHDVMYDVKEDGFDSLGMIEAVGSYEEAVKLRDALSANPNYYNIDIIERTLED